MFNINDPFYQDLFTPYKTENNTDMPLSARKYYIYNNKDSQCQSNCQFSSYLLNSLYINCSCNIEQKEEKAEKEVKKFGRKTLYENFYDVLKYANFKILTCYNLSFDKYIFKKNIGNYIILAILSTDFICLIFFIAKGMFLLRKIIKEITSPFKTVNENQNIIIINNIRIQNRINNKKMNKIKMISNPNQKKKKSTHINNISNKDIKIVKPRKSAYGRNEKVKKIHFVDNSKKKKFFKFFKKSIEFC